MEWRRLGSISQAVLTWQKGQVTILQIQRQQCRLSTCKNKSKIRANRNLQDMIWTRKPIVKWVLVIISRDIPSSIGVSVVCSTVCSGVDQRKHQSSESLAFVRGIHRWPVNSPHKGPVTRKMFPFDDVIMDVMIWYRSWLSWHPSSTSLGHPVDDVPREGRRSPDDPVAGPRLPGFRPPVTTIRETK